MEHATGFSTRKALFAGAWYKKEAAPLRQTIKLSLRSATNIESQQPELQEPARAALLPHAGLEYSGRGISHLLLHFPETVTRVLILAPSHYAFLPMGKLTVAGFDSYETPLGILDGWQLAESEALALNIDQKALQQEHAVEMFLPFLAWQKEESGFPFAVNCALISQIAHGRQLEKLARGLIAAIGMEEIQAGRCLLIASSDLTHYGHRFGYTPFGSIGLQTTRDAILRQDLMYTHTLAKGSHAQVEKLLQEGSSTVCGLAPGALVSEIARICGFEGFVVDYYTSLDVQRTAAEDLVSYGSILWR